MLLSKKHKFIFIHVPKVAGQSVANALVPYAAAKWQHLLAPLMPFGYQLKCSTKLRQYTGLCPSSQPCTDHVRASQLVDALGAENFKKYYSFAFVRNPWAWTWSLYTYALKSPRHSRHKLVKDLGSFAAYLDWHCHEDPEFQPQKSFVCDAGGALLLDFVGKQENLKEDFAAVCDALKIQTKLPTFNVSRSGSYHDQYDAQMRDLVADEFREDIEF